MQKDFTRWHLLKNTIHGEKERPYIHERDIWFCSLGLNVGYEQDGRGKNLLRPVVVVKKFNQELCWSVPLTKTTKENHPYFLTFSFDGATKSSAILSQIRLIDAKRMHYKIGMMPLRDFKEMKKRLLQFLA